LTKPRVDSLSPQKLLVTEGQSNLSYRTRDGK